MADGAGLRTFQLSDPACAAAWESQPMEQGRCGPVLGTLRTSCPAVLHCSACLLCSVDLACRMWRCALSERRRASRYGRIVEMEVEGRPALLKIFEGLKTDARRRGKAIEWLRPLKEMFHLLKARRLPWTCGLIGFVTAEPEPLSKAASSAATSADPTDPCPPLRVVGLVMEFLRPQDGYCARAFLLCAGLVVCTTGSDSRGCGRAQVDDG